MLRVGAYKKGMDKELDIALLKKDKIRIFLSQGINELYSYDNIVKMLKDVTDG
jgi:flagellum-specific ATP synthase